MNFSPKKHRDVVAHAAVTLALVQFAAGTVTAQAPQGADGEAGDTPGCYAVAPTRQVDIAIEGGETTRGTLTCLSQSQATLVHDGVMSQIPLRRIRRIRTPADPVWDGAAKGAVIPLIFWAVFCHSCNAEPFLRASLVYGLSGLVTDAIDTNRETLYRRRVPALSVGWSFRF